MFASLGLFKDVECPEVLQCSMPNCIFAHQGKQNVKKRDIDTSHPLVSPNGPNNLNGEEVSIDQITPPRKRIRMADREDENVTKTADVSIKSPKSPKNASVKSESSGGAFYGVSLSKPKTQITQIPLKKISSSPSSKPRIENNGTDASKKRGSTATMPKTAKNCNHEKPDHTSVKETLNPRILPNPPASHAIRYKLISLLHEHITKLNEQVKAHNDTSKSIILMTPEEIITEVLDEEERTAKTHPSIYTNILKRRVSHVKGMSVEAWMNERRNLKASTSTVSPEPKAKSIDFSVPEEFFLLKHLYNDQRDLVKYDYVMSAPTRQEIEQARQGVQTAQNWENCERCETRFQVFPGRRADGALTTNSPCRYHPSRHFLGNLHTCCQQTVGESAGCKLGDSHVFKVSEAKRLALTFPYVETPPNPTLATNWAVNFDCEMGFTTLGLELIRMTATMWPDGDRLVDVLVRPQGEILDLNSAYSGVRQQDYKEATPYSSAASIESATANSSKDFRPLKVVDSPAEARKLLFRYISPTTPLIGHALQNDLNATRIIHPTIIDTAILYPHYKGLPMRTGLKSLAKKYLDREIQMGGEKGHDSREDANSAGDLVRLKCKELWNSMQKDGWTFSDGQYIPPPSAEPGISTGTRRKARLGGF